MSIIKWEPFSETDRFFEDFPNLSLKNFGKDLHVDLYEEGENIISKVNLPGVNPEKINISIEDNSLRISASTEEEKETKDKYYYTREIKSGYFERLIPLPQAVQKQKASAEYENGLLKIILPRANGAESPHKVEVKIKK